MVVLRLWLRVELMERVARRQQVLRVIASQSAEQVWEAELLPMAEATFAKIADSFAARTNTKDMSKNLGRGLRAQTIFPSGRI
jgi:hypothetical protein